MSGDRFPVEVKALGLLKHGKQKAYMLSVSWSDHTNILIYRTFEEFKKLHKELKRKFPIESGLLKKSERTIPKFQAAHLRQRMDRNRRQSLERLKLLEIYCTELLKVKAKISQGEDVTRFLEAQSQDLDPSFPENSVIILPSETRERKEDTPKPSTPTITQPVISQSYSCIEAFETKDTKNRPFHATKGENLEVLLKDRTGWWLVENDQKQIAWFPAPYLEETEEASVVRETNEEEFLYYIKRSYKARNQDELSVNIGVVVEVLEKTDNGWWLVWYNGRAGYVPSMFLRPYKNPHSKFLALAHSNLCVSTPNLSDVTTPFRRNAPNQRKGDHLDAPQPRSTSDAEGEKDSPLSRIRSRSLNGVDQDSLSESSGSGSEQGLYWARKIEAQTSTSPPQGVIYQPASGTQDRPSTLLDSKKWSDSGFGEEPFACADDSLCSSCDSEGSPGGPTVPTRPSDHEILQKCSTITKRAVQRARPRPTLPTCSQSHH
ncbi:NADPH oxidase organizer 1 [Heteronotia binoei]|uniref:NADPH oxidase organizer 1 n=1 Tax=Heteronotia binoei TaxID=13085 RepID=UPI00292DF488|nr:NADPH oxidase organizer 1 [Heteronotia binoei]